MTQPSPDTLSWLSLLAPSHATQIAILTDMIKHANGDGMSFEDRTICINALGWLQGQPVDESKITKRAWGHTCPDCGGKCACTQTNSGDPCVHCEEFDNASVKQSVNAG